MAKYSYEFKKEIVMAYIQGEGGYEYLSKKYGVKSTRDIRKWVNAYKAFGDEGLMRSRNNKKYTFEFKLSVVELYLTTEVSYQELALSVGINNPPLITKRVNDYRIAGPNALREKCKGRRAIVPKPKNTDNNNENAGYIKQLENAEAKALIRELEKKNAELERANDILKDALGFFAKDRKK